MSLRLSTPPSKVMESKSTDSSLTTADNHGRTVCTATDLRLRPMSDMFFPLHCRRHTHVTGANTHTNINTHTHIQTHT